LRVEGLGLKVGGWGLGFGVKDQRGRHVDCQRCSDPVWSGCGVQGSGFGVWELGVGVQGSGFGVWGLGFRVWGPGFRVQGLGFRVQG